MHFGGESLRNLYRTLSWLLRGAAVSACVAAVVLMAIAPQARAQDNPLLVPVALGPTAGFIGSVRSGIVAFGTPVNLGRRTLAPADNVALNEVVETLAGGALNIEFIDGTVFQIGENGRMILDELVFDPATGEGNLLIHLAEGVFHIVSGAIPKKNFKIVTPVATIGIRGTVFEVTVGEFGETSVSVFEGEVEIEPHAASGDAPVADPEARQVIAKPGESVTVAVDGGDPVRGQAVKSNDPGLLVRDDAAHGNGKDDKDDNAGDAANEVAAAADAAADAAASARDAANEVAAAANAGGAANETAAGSNADVTPAAINAGGPAKNKG